MDFNSSEANIAWFRDRYRDGSLEIRPPYQRKPVWTQKQKCYLIESILLKLPVPEIFVQQTIGDNEALSYAVVDGQQRIRTILQFIGAEGDPEQEDYNKFPLDKLDANSPWKNLTFAELTDTDRNRFYLYNFGVRYLNTNSDDEVKDMFRRLNKFLTPLNAQELRTATYSGPFVELSLNLANDDYWTENRIFTPALIRRMNDVQFVSELVIGVLHGPQAGSDRVIDEYYEHYETYDGPFPDQRLAESLFDEALDTLRAVLPDIKETRWSNRTDFYTLFVAVAQLLRTKSLPKKQVRALRLKLSSFEENIYKRLADERAKVGKEAVAYVRAVERGANDKKRRADRHSVMVSVLKHYFK